MPFTGYVSAQEGRCTARALPSLASGRHGLAQRKLLIVRFIALLAVCLSAGPIAYIILFAFDSDPEVWPFGAESYSVDSHGLLNVSDAPISVSAAWTAIWCFVTTAGAHLVVRYRARSALAADSPLISLASNLAEPWDCT